MPEAVRNPEHCKQAHSRAEEHLSLTHNMDLETCTVIGTVLCRPEEKFGEDEVRPKQEPKKTQDDFGLLRTAFEAAVEGLRAPVVSRG